MNKIGLIPAAGYARRLKNLSCSKEMIPVDYGYGVEPVCQSLLRQFNNADIKDIVVVTRPDKTDLVAHLRDNIHSDLNIEIVLLESSSSTLESHLFRIYFNSGEGCLSWFSRHDFISIRCSETVSEFQPSLEYRCSSWGHFSRTIQSDLIWLVMKRMAIFATLRSKISNVIMTGPGYWHPGIQNLPDIL